MVGDAGVATDLVAGVVSRRRMRRAIAAADDAVVVAALVRSALRIGTVDPAEASPLAALTSHERVAVVLAFAAGWDLHGIAEAMRVRPGRGQGHVQHALHLASQRDWRALLADDRWGVAAPPGRPGAPGARCPPPIGGMARRARGSPAGLPQSRTAAVHNNGRAHLRRLPRSRWWRAWPLSPSAWSPRRRRCRRLRTATSCCP